MHRHRYKKIDVTIGGSWQETPSTSACADETINNGFLSILRRPKFGINREKDNYEPLMCEGLSAYKFYQKLGREHLLQACARIATLKTSVYGL